MKKITHIFMCVLLVLLAGRTKAQISGVVTVPGTYSSIAAVINTLNVGGVSGAVTVNIAAGYTETAPFGGYMLNTIAGASAANQVIFQKSGTGANPLISAYTNGYNTPSSAAQDGMWNFNGTDWVTIDGIDLTDPNTVNPLTMEYGFGFFKASGTNGCQNNTIKNCVITLSRNNNGSGSNPSLEGSRGINMINALVTSQTTAITALSAAGANSNNKFYSNTIQNCLVGIALYGFQGSSPFPFADSGNDIGGSSAATGNTLINFGGVGTSPAASGVLIAYQYNINCSNNTINSNNGSGVNHPGDLRGIFLLNGDNASATISSNTITLKGGGNSSLSPIVNSAGTNGTNNTISMTNNLITNCTNVNATSGTFVGLSNTTSASTVIVTGNSILNNSTNATSGSFYPIINSGSVSGVLTITNNLISGTTFSATSTSLTHYNINVSSVASTCTLSISNNTIQNVTYAGTTGGTGAFRIISTAGGLPSSGSAFIQNNLVNPLTIKTTGTSYLFYLYGYTSGTTAVTGNTISGITRLVGGSNSIAGIYNDNSTSSGNIATFSNNVFSNFNNGTSSGSLYGLYWSTTGTVSIASNTITNFTGLSGTGSIVGLYPYYYQTVLTMSNNLVSNFSYGNGSLYGILYGDYYTTTNTVNSNTLTNLQCAGSSVYGIYMQYTGGNISNSNNNFYKNKISDIGSSNSSASQVSGIYINPSYSGNVNMYNNLIANITASASTNANAVDGIYIASLSGLNINMYYNSIFMNGTSTASGFGSAGVYAGTGTNLNMRNNIIVNNGLGTGSGIVSAYRRSSTTATTYSATSNNNLFYAGIPSSNNSLYIDGTNNALTLTAYKALMVNRDQASVTENVSFLSTVATATNFLMVNTTIPTAIEAAASPVAGITDDYAGVTRNATTPDIGAFEDNYLVVAACSGTPGTPSIVSASTVLCTNANAILSIPSTYTANGVTFQWQQSIASAAGPFFTIPGATTTAYSNVVGFQNTWYRAVVTCSAGGSATTAPFPIMIGTGLTPTTVASAVNICAGQSSNLSLSGATGPAGLGYQWQASTTGSVGPYSPIIGSTLTTLTATNITANTWYQAVVSCSANPSASVASVPTQINSTSLTIAPTASAATASVCPNGTSALSLTGTITGLSYQWQASTTGSNTGFASVANATTAAYTSTMGTATTWYQAVASCTANTSMSVTSTPVMVVAGLPSTLLPVAATTSVVVCPTSTISLSTTGTITGLAYQWQTSTTGSNTGYAAVSTATNSTYTPSVNANTWYQAVVSCSANPSFSLASTPVLVSLGSTVIPVATAASSTICPNSTSSLSLTVSGVIPSSGLTYQWQASTTGSNTGYAAVASANSVPYTATVGATTWYQAIASCSANTAYSVASTPVLVTIGNPTISPVSSVSNPNICGGSTASLSLLNASAPTGVLYQWQSSTTGSNTGYAAISTTATSAAYNATVSTSGWYQAVVSCSANSAYSVTSTPVYVNVTTPQISAFAAAASTTLCPNVTSVVSLTNVTGVSGTLIYQWQASTTGSTSGYANATGTSTNSTYTSTTPVSGGTWYQAVISCSTSPTSSVLSTPVLITSALPSMTPVTAAASTVLCSGLTDNLTLSGVSASGLGYQWQSSSTGLAGSYASISTATNNAYTATVSANTWYQAVISCSANTSFSIASAAISVTASAPTSATAAASSTLLCPGLTSNLTLSGASGSGLNYQWQSSTTGSNTGYAAVGSATNSAYTPTVSATTWYQAVISCSATPASSIISTPILVTTGVPVASTVTAVSSPTSICAGFSNNLSLSASAGSGVVYQWLASSTSSSSGYASIANATLSTLTNTVSVNGNNWYAAVVSCSAAPSVSLTSAPVNLVRLTGPTASITTGTNTVCGTSQFTLNGGSDIGTSFAWTGPGGFTSSAQNPVITNSVAGVYTLVTTGTVNACTSVPATFAMNVIGNVTGGVLSTSTSTVCSGAGTTATLQVTPLGIPVSAYSFSPSTGASLIALSTGSVQLTGANVDDTQSAITAIGFTFTYNGTDYTQFSTSPNGWIGLGGGTYSNEWNNGTYPSTTNSNKVRIAPYYDDQYTGVGGYVVYQLFGTSPTRSLVVEWATLIPYTTSSGASANTHYQAILYEGSNAIEFRYGAMGTDATGLSSCGLESNVSATTNFLSVTYSTNTASGFAMNNLNNTQPASGTSYMFTVPAIAPTYTWAPGASVSATSGTMITSTPAASTTYSVNYTMQGCVASKTIAITAYQTPTVNITASSTTLCPGTTATLTASGAVSYSWNTSSTNTSIVVASPASPVVYTLTGNNSTCGSATKTITISQANSSITLSGSSGICTGQTATITASGASTYTWSTGATTSSITDAPVTNGTFTYGVVGTDAAGCLLGNSQILNVAAGLNIGITSASVSCSGQSLSLVGSGGVTYTWSVGSATAASIVDSPTTTTTYSLIGASGTCSNIAVKTITVNANPTLTVSANATVCAGSPATITANGAATYSWSSNATGTAVVVSPTNTTVYTVVGTSTAFCTDTKTVSVFTNTLPVITIAQSATAACALVPVTFTASGASNYTWTSGPTTSINVVAPTTAIAGAIYTVTGASSANCISTKTVALTTYSLPVVTISPSSASICLTSSIALAASGASTYAWSGGPNTNTYNVTPSGSTVYTVTGTSSDGCVSTKTAGITSYSLPVVTVSSNTTNVCSQGSVALTAGGANTYTWTGTALTGSAVTVFPISSTVYTVTGITTQNCSSTNTVAITTMSLPAITVSPAQSTVCANSSASYTASGAITYTWANNSTITGSTAVLTTTGLTAYNISGTGSNGCSSNGGFIVFTNALPVITVAASTPTVCSLSPVTFTAAGADSYNWSNSQNGGVITVNPANNSTYTVTGTNTVTGCTNTQTVAVTTSALPSVVISPASPTVCSKSPVTLTGSGASSYAWSNGSINNSINLTPSVTVSYTLTGTDAIGCSNVQTVTVTVNALPTIVAPSQTVCLDDVATFTPSGASTYTINPGNLTSNYSVSQSIAGIYNYTVSGTDANGCVNKTAVILDVENCVGIKTHSYSGNLVSVYPNPSNGVFTAQFNFAGEKTVMIINTVGQLVAEKVTSNTSEVFDMSHLAKGVYYVKVSSKEASGNYRIIIE